MVYLFFLFLLQNIDCGYSLELIDSKISFGDITIDKSSSLPCIHMKIRTLRLTVAEKTSKLKGNPFLKSHTGTIPYIVCENEI